MANKILLALTLATFVPAVTVSAQNPGPYPNAVTDRLVHQETPMAPPASDTPDRCTLPW